MTTNNRIYNKRNSHLNVSVEALARAINHAESMNQHVVYYSWMSDRELCADASATDFYFNAGGFPISGISSMRNARGESILFLQFDMHP
jgi:hypothetical protein